jgi:hypothetical protein
MLKHEHAPLVYTHVVGIQGQFLQIIGKYVRGGRRDIYKGFGILANLKLKGLSHVIIHI